MDRAVGQRETSQALRGGPLPWPTHLGFDCSWAPTTRGISPAFAGFRVRGPSGLQLEQHASGTHLAKKNSPDSVLSAADTVSRGCRDASRVWGFRHIRWTAALGLRAGIVRPTVPQHRSVPGTNAAVNG